MLYSDAVKTDHSASFGMYPLRSKKYTHRHGSRRRMCEAEVEDQNEKTVATAMAAVQQLSETSTPVIQQAVPTNTISWIWDKPGEGCVATKPSDPCTASIIPVGIYAKMKQYQPYHPPVPRQSLSSPRSQRQEVPHEQSSSRPFAANSRHNRSRPSISKSTPKQTEPNFPYDTPEGRWIPWIDPDSHRVHWEFHTYSKVQIRSKPAPKKNKTTFLSLPGELRNQIYAEVLPECRVLILRTHPNKELDILKNTWSTADLAHKRPRARLYHKLDNSQMMQGLGLTTNLLLTCKAVKSDVELYLYSRTTFCFDSMRVFDHFMRSASFHGLQAIQKLELSHAGYGNPQLTENDEFHARYYNRWGKTCTMVGEKLISLKHLKVNAHLRQWPCDMSELGSDTQWRNAFLQLAPRRLAKVDLVLHHSMFDRNTRLMRDIAHKLAGDMMTDEGCHERDYLETKQVMAVLEARRAEKIARQRAAEAKARAPTELTITMDEVKKQKVAPVKYCNKGLDKYSRLLPVNMQFATLDATQDQNRLGKGMK